MRKDSYAYFITVSGELRDIGAKLLEKYKKLIKFENLQKAKKLNLKWSSIAKSPHVNMFYGRNISYIKNSISKLLNKNSNLYWNHTITYRGRNKSID